MGFSRKQQRFIEEYPVDFNATQAAIRAGYSEKTAYSIGQENLKKPEIASAIQERIDTLTMRADEVLIRLGQIARGSVADFADIEKLSDLRNHPLAHLVKKIKSKKRIDDAGVEYVDFEFELYSSHEALRDIGKYHALFTERVEHSGEVNIKGYTVVSPDSWDNDDQD